MHFIKIPLLLKELLILIFCKNMKIALLTGGPSLERGISLNSARSVLDHLGDKNIEIIPIYFDRRKRAYKISRAELYSNNPSDFDFKLAERTSPLSIKTLVRLLKSADIAFPAMHGPFGEDGEIQRFLEKNRIPFVGSGSKSCKLAFNKFKAGQLLAEEGFTSIPRALLKIYSKSNSKIIHDFFQKNGVQKVIIKPATGGSSIGVFSANSPREALQKVKIIFSKRLDTQAVIEPFLEGKEFTVIVLENKLGLPAAIMPTEIEMAYHEGRIFDFRKKYLPTNQVRYHCPARFSHETIERIQAEAKQIFSLFGMRDFARFDGWLLPDGKIVFVDLNPISGMEQNSFLFQQGSRIGLSHKDLLLYILRSSCVRQNIFFPPNSSLSNKVSRKTVPVVFGGNTSERQVSLMSGTNVWLKLLKSERYEPRPYLLDFQKNVWELPYALILNHTVEEILSAAECYPDEERKSRSLTARARAELMLAPGETELPVFAPRRFPFAELAKKSRFIFLALHGGDGENGNFQKILSRRKVKFNGSGEKTSRLCINKYALGKTVQKLGIPGLSTARQALFPLKSISQIPAKKTWEELMHKLGSNTVIVKPNDDGCSTGVARLSSAIDLENYLRFLNENKPFIPAGFLSRHKGIIEMPAKKPAHILFEEFIRTDLVKIKGNKLKYYRRTGWLEVTIGVLEELGRLHAFFPSLTVAEGQVLSLEEKFQGGTGVNITPPPSNIAKAAAIEKARRLTETLSQKIGIKGYARIDAFMNVYTGALSIIEINTLPGLTASTVLYHQALAEKPPIFPLELLEKIIKNSGY